MARHVVRARLSRSSALLRDQMTLMLKADGPPPSGKWADFAVLEPVRGYKARHASTLPDVQRRRRRPRPGHRARHGERGGASFVSALVLGPRRAAIAR